MTVEDWLAHLDNCPRCKPWSPCTDGARILEVAAEAIAYRIGPVLVDIEKPVGEA